MTITALQTDRLTLTPIESSMLAELHTLFTSPSVRRYLLDDEIVEPDWVEDVITTSQQQFEEGGYGLWAIQQTGKSTIIGVCGYFIFSQLQLLYALLPAYWGKGYATEAARAVISYGFEQVGMTEIVAAADKPNATSFDVMERLGMTYWKTEETIVYYRLRSGRVFP